MAVLAGIDCGLIGSRVGVVRVTRCSARHPAEGLSTPLCFGREIGCWCVSLVVPVDGYSRPIPRSLGFDDFARDAGVGVYLSRLRLRGFEEGFVVDLDFYLALVLGECF